MSTDDCRITVFESRGYREEDEAKENAQLHAEWRHHWRMRHHT